MTLQKYYPVLTLTPSDIAWAMDTCYSELSGKDMEAIAERIYEKVWATVREEYWCWVKEATKIVLEEKEQ